MAPVWKARRASRGRRVANPAFIHAVVDYRTAGTLARISASVTQANPHPIRLKRGAVGTPKPASTKSTKPKTSKIRVIMSVGISTHMAERKISLEMSNASWGKVAVTVQHELNQLRNATRSMTGDARLPHLREIQDMAKIRDDIRNQRRAIRYGQVTDRSVSKLSEPPSGRYDFDR